MRLKLSSAISPAAPGLRGTDTRTGIEHADKLGSGRLPIQAPPASRSRACAIPYGTAYLRLLPGNVLAHIVALLDAPSRRAVGGTDRHTRALLTPQCQFDRLLAAIRWADSSERLAELLGSAAGQPAPQRGALLCGVIEQSCRLGSISVSLLTQLMEQIETLPAAERDKPLVALAAVLGRLSSREHELEKRTLALAGQLPQGKRGQALGHCLMCFRPATTPAGFQEWMAMVDALPPDGASRLLEAVVDVAARQQQLSGELVASVLERVRALRTADGMPAPCQAWVLEKLVSALDSVVEAGIEAKSRLAAWDAILDTTGAALRSGHWPLLVAVALHRWLGGGAVLSVDQSPRTARLTELYGSFTAKELLETAGSDARLVMRSMFSYRDLMSIGRRFAEAAELDAPTQARLLTEYSHLFVTMPGVERDDHLEDELFRMGLQRIEALNPASLRVEPLIRWGAALEVSESAALWMAFANAVNALSPEDRTRVLMETISPSRSRIGFSIFLQQTAALPPALGGPLLGKLALRTIVRTADEQAERVQALTKLAAKWPPSACTDLVVNTMSCADMLDEDVVRRLRRFAADIVVQLSLAERARVLSELAEHGSLAARGWVLEQLLALAKAQRQLAIAGEPMLPYRAEIVRRMIVSMGQRFEPTEIQLRALWPALREALDGLEPQARGSAVAALRTILTRLRSALRDDVAQALATRWSVDRPAQPELHAGAKSS